MKNQSSFMLLNSASNPLPPCPHSPNCIRQTYHISSKKEHVYSLVVDTLQKMGAVSIHEDAENLSVQAVFKVLFFKDDVDIMLEPQSDHTLLHIRSASRTGHYDFGVNTRRVNRIIKRLSARLSGAQE